MDKKINGILEERPLDIFHSFMFALRALLHEKKKEKREKRENKQANKQTDETSSSRP
jgi:hypothetical protein